MAFNLFEHNRAAYESAVNMMKRTGKAAVIHPTGTGKSFIAFQLALDNPDKRICWLSPSEYIFRTQIDNLLSESPNISLNNVQFYTYARLMTMTDKEIEDILPDYIILDEFHRCGALVWGAGVIKVLKTFKEAHILGLSATNIRYLDNQRDMADELFDGNVASYISLGEALARGILNTPKYIVALYSYERSLDKLATRVCRAKSPATREKAEAILQELRRKLARAEKIEQIFQRHMENRTGKYIVFCASKEHLDEVVDKALQWFSLVDTEPHIYTVYSKDPYTEKSFDAFKYDESSHLKLLFCIDMLNEGIHIEDITGVILIRPTISPIIYKQQIGRALSASKKTKPIIFDVVNNFENLYSIGAIEEEFEEAVRVYQDGDDGEDSGISSFEIFDEVRDCRGLFRELEEMLSASWDTMFEYAKRYYEQNGNLEISGEHYFTEEGYPLGRWLQTQRRVRAGTQGGILTEEQIARLDSIGMIWGNWRDFAWERALKEAKKYYECRGDLKVPKSYVSESGFRLGSWIRSLREYRKAGLERNYLRGTRIQQLDELGMIWDVSDYQWQRNYCAAVEYHRAHGDLHIPVDYVSQDGVALGKWRSNLRREYNAGRLSRERIRALEALGMVWTTRFEQQWETGYSHAQRYYEQNGDLNVSCSYKAEDGYPLGSWLHHQRGIKYRLTPEQVKKLDEIAIIWKKPTSWERRYDLSKEYYLRHGNLNIPQSYIVEGIWLGTWLAEQRKIKKGVYPDKKLTTEQIAALDAIGMDWLNVRERAWENQYEEVKNFYKGHGHLKIPRDSEKNIRMCRWLSCQRRDVQKNKLTKNQIQQLREIGLEFDNTGCEQHD